MDQNGTALADRERNAIAAICLMAARADGLRDEERERLKQVFEGLGGVDTTTLYQRVLLGQMDLAETAATLGSPGLRSFAYEMAVGVCDADGHTTSAERDFLRRLAEQLQIPATEASAMLEQAEELADAPLEATTTASGPSASAKEPGAVDESELERKILHRAVLAGALELLPQSLATMAIVPAQMKLVHEIGRAHGHTLDQTSIRELLAIAGVGMTSQVLEGYARKIFGGALRKTAGKGAGMVGRTATSALMTFSTTYAIGKVAVSYYGAGRTLDRDQLRQVFQNEIERGKALFDRHRGDVQSTASTTNVSDLAQLIRS